MSDYDAIVVGAGPGGAAAAHNLASRGRRVLVLEKKLFPREKVCGDGLTPRAVRIMREMGLDAQIENYTRVQGLRCIGAGRVLELKFPPLAEWCTYGLVRRRRDLDAEVLERATAAGAKIWEQTEAVAPLMEDGGVRGVRYRAPGGEEGQVRAPFTVIADGASSPFGKKLGPAVDGAAPLGLALRSYYESERSSDGFFESWLQLRNPNGELLPGYGWVFPVGDGTVNVGVGILTTFGKWRDINLAKLQDAFVKMLPDHYGVSESSRVAPFQSGRLPMGLRTVKPYGPGFVMVGDAAGVVNPFNGEGIAYALETGQLAGHLIARALDEGGGLAAAGNGQGEDEAAGIKLRVYGDCLRARYGPYYKMGRAFVNLIGKPAVFQALVAAGMRSQTAMNFALKILGNLYSSRGTKVSDRAFRSLVRLAGSVGQAEPDRDSPAG